jgi:hypothetical protein
VVEFEYAGLPLNDTPCGLPPSLEVPNKFEDGRLGTGDEIFELILEFGMDFFQIGAVDCAVGRFLSLSIKGTNHDCLSHQ